MISFGSDVYTPCLLLKDFRALQSLRKDLAFGKLFPQQRSKLKLGYIFFENIIKLYIYFNYIEFFFFIGKETSAYSDYKGTFKSVRLSENGCQYNIRSDTGCTNWVHVRNCGIEWYRSR